MMKKFLVALLLFVSIQSVSLAQVDYAKYGRIATAVVKEDYTGSPLKEYKYLGRQEVSKDEVKDAFQFSVTDGGKDKLVVVEISHNLKNDKLLKLNVYETNS
ncbi:DUF3889 domain-containing protein [Mangrovibacillus cuniculi]|uniref:DUF3889 domain-containing protein n=1 Tax=Mangrovibacillus cuniculi TaxID=2593652 RepID=A0A7S8C9F5_9BACI|nr:DUF3889 domain-containing protein [Mangrovibacillus cuniculi]QPC45850.1 DUF3889 domain-containing protein [Mangrovibacillus cuniculi]